MIFIMNRMAILAALLALAQAGSAAAQAVSTGSLRLDEVLAEVKTKNPELLAAKSLSAMARSRVKQSYALSDPSLEFERMNTKYGNNFISDAGDRTIGIRQEIENPYRLLLKKRAARSESAVYLALYDGKMNEVLARAKTVFYQYYIYGRYEAIYLETIDLLKEFSRIAEDKYAAGLGGQGDAIKAQVELSRTLNMLITLQQEKEAARAQLNVLMDRGAEDYLPDAAEYRPSLTMSEFSQFEAAALKNNPAIKTALAKLDEAGSKLTLSKAEYLPDFELLYRRRRSTDERMDRTYDVMLGVTLPLGWTGNKGAGVKEARFGRDMAEAEYKLEKNGVSLEIKDALIKAKTSLRLLDLYRTSVIPQAQQALKISRTSYQSSKGGFLDLLDAERTLLDLKTDYYRYTVEYQTWLTELERLTGQNIPEGK